MIIAASALSGLLLALAFPKFSLGWLAWVALAPFFFALGRVKGWKEALVNGGIFGVIFFGVNLFWVTSLFRFAGWWAVLGWGALTIFQTLFLILFSISCFRLSMTRLSDSTERLDRARRGLVEVSSKSFDFRLSIPLLWVLIEWLRAFGPFGVTGGDLGYTQVGYLPVIQIASFTSVYGISFMIALVNASLAMWIADRNRWKWLIVSLLIAAGAWIWGAAEINNAHLNKGVPVKVALIQPNIDQMDKMDPEKIGPVFTLQENLSRQALRQKPDIIIWPETAVFSYLTHDPQLFPRIKQLAIDARAWLIVGAPHYDLPGRAFNAMLSISPSGEVFSRYDKMQLVPFGEYLPFRKFLFPVLKAVGYYEHEFSPGSRSNKFLAGKMDIAPAICFESAFPDIIRRRVNKNTAFILTITNDAWFGRSAAPYAHLDAGVLRAVENRKYFVQVGNTGFTAVIDPYGRIVARSELNQRQVIMVDLKG
jgi:apolipoprotein N-acyltransferase